MIKKRGFGRDSLAVFLWLALVFFPSLALGQDAVPGDIFLRTFFIKVGNETGTTFSIKRNDHIYLVTARHVVAALPDENATIQIWRADKWDDVAIKSVLHPPSSKADIAVLVPEDESPWQAKFEIQPQDKGPGGVTFGQQLWFLGYPFGGLGTYIGNTLIPFMKRGTMSALDTRDPNAIVLFIDGFNNPGFSGGPIVYWNFTARRYEIFGVVVAYEEDHAKKIINGQQVDSDVLVNSGILLGYSIKHALQAIDGQP